MVLPLLRGGGGEHKRPSSQLGYNDLRFWFVTSDYIYYADTDELFKSSGITPHKILITPNKNEIYSLIAKQEQFSVLSPNKPSPDLKGLFVLIEPANKFGLLTTQQKLAQLEEAKVLEADLGLSVIKSPFTLSSLGGAYALKEYTKQLLEAEKKGFKARGIFLVGIPGTGKTFFPKCFAGELNRLLIQLNLTLLLESPEPIGKLNEIFSYLADRYRKNPEEKYVILIDEIEKMIGNGEAKERRVLGRMLSVLNDFNTEASEYNFNAIFFATANDLGTILANNPEFLRRGRWDELFFINLPTHEYANDIFQIYIKKFNIQFMLDIVDIDELFVLIERKYQRDNEIASRFPYTAAEIETFCKRIDFLKKAKGEEISKKDIEECVDMIIPIVKTAREGIAKMAGQRELFVEI